MPHATGDEEMGYMDEDDAIQRYLNQNGPDGGASEFLQRDIDQRDKAQDAVDYEDISDDDDLPDEEQAEHHLEDDEGLNGIFSQPPNGIIHTNGYHDAVEPSSDDLFGNGEEGNDLFGEHFSSPEQERQTQNHAQAPPQHRPGGLALPSKSGLALPVFEGHRNAQPPQPPRSHHMQHTPTSLSPPSFRSDEYSPAASNSVLGSEDELAGETDQLVITQWKLMKTAKRRQAGERVEEEKEQINQDEFYTFFPGYEEEHNPRFIAFFPQRPVKYRGKVPPKAPKPVQPTKLSLDLLPDQERSFKSVAAAPRNGQETDYSRNLVFLRQGGGAEDDSDDDLALSIIDEEEIGGVTMADLAMICEDWDMPSIDTESILADEDQLMEGEWEAEERARPMKKRRMNVLDADLSMSVQEPRLSFEEPERAAAKLAKRVTLDLNDPNLLVDEHAPLTARRVKRIPGDIRRDAALTRDLARRYNVSNDEAYDLLKENHQHKVRSTLGGTALEHSLPATKLQYPFYRVALDPKAKRSFHRPSLQLKDWETRPQKEFRFGKLKTIKRKERRGRDVKDLFATSESLAFNDNSNMLLLEYSEEVPMTISNFGMGNKLVNFYRKRNADDQERPKREIGETHVLLTQDKSPFSNFGHVDQGEVVPTVQNGLYRAPVFQHQAKPVDFYVNVSSTHEYGSRMYIRNVENLHAVGQQFPIAEVPGEHSRRVTDAAKKRLRALAYRIYTKSQNPARRDKILDNATLMKHLKGHDMPQTRSKMREFMKYERNANKEGGVWIPGPGQIVPDAETLRSWVRPEDICLLDSMQVGVQHLNDLGLGGKDEDEEKEQDENANIEQLLAPWRATKNFIHATQGKAMLKLHGEGDPTGRGEGFSFVKTSMKGGFQALGESVQDKLDAKKRRENGGHTYNVAKQQKAYDDYIRMIWERQKNSLSSNIELSDNEMDDDVDADPESAHPFGRAGTPRSSFAGTPAGHSRRDDETGTQFSRASADRGTGRVLIIKRTGGRDAYGQEDDGIEKISNPKVIREYIKRKNERRLAAIDPFLYVPTGADPELDRLVEQVLVDEKLRVQRNVDRREARERAKGRTVGAGSPSASIAGSPGPSEPDAPNGAVNGSSTNGTPQKGRGRNKDGTARKCANCGQVGHIKTNRKLCPLLNGTQKTEDANPNGDSSFGAVPAPLTL